MNDGSIASLAWTVLALGSGTLLVFAAVSRFRRAGWLAFAALVLLAISAIGGASEGRALAVGIVAALAAIVLLFQGLRRQQGSEPRRQRRLVLLAIISGGIACGAFIDGVRTSFTPIGDPMLLLDPTSERAELLAEVDAARLEVELVLQRDLPVRERSAREARDWQRLELLSRIRARAQQDRDALLEFAQRLADPAASPPGREEVQALLEGLERLLGAVRLQ